MPIDTILERLRHHTSERFGFLRVDWTAMVNEFPDGFDTEAGRIVTAWLDALVAHRSDGARWTNGAQFHLVEFPTDPRATDAVRFAAEVAKSR